ncbi:MAG: DUF2330 domain-containing protein [Polyangiaceae bacterium]
MKRRLSSAGLFSAGLFALGALSARPAGAFLIVGTDAAQSPGDETRVFIVREEGRSLLAIAPTVRGPAKPLAIVIPVPPEAASSVRAASITTLERTDKLTAPRLDEAWELDPCELHPDQQQAPSGAAAATSAAPAAPAMPAKEADFDLQLIAPSDAAQAPKWLTDHGYKLPDGAEAALAAVTAKGDMALLVARIDGARLTFDKEQARVPPLGFVMPTAYKLPLALTAVGAKGPHDTVIDVLAAGGLRVEAANMLNLAAPTNLDVTEEAKGNADGLFRAVIDHAVEKTPGAAITEYAWPAASCDRCEPGTAFAAADLLALGVDRLPSAEDGSQREVMIDVPESLARAPEGPPELRRGLLTCYANTLRDMAGLAGDASVEVKTGDGGAVTSTRIKDASAEALGKCVEEAARAVKLDKPNATDVIKVKFALVSRKYLGEMTLTRLRVRNSPGKGGDLELRPAAAIEGGREEGPEGKAEQKVYFAEHANNFRERAVIRHPWTGPVACDNPKRGAWGPKPKTAASTNGKPSSAPSASASSSGKPAATSAADKALAPLLEGGALPDLAAYAIAYRAAEPPKPPPTTPAPPASSAPPPAPSAAPTGGGGCGCHVIPASEGPNRWLAITAIAACLSRIRRRRGR